MKQIGLTRTLTLLLAASLYGEANAVAKAAHGARVDTAGVCLFTATGTHVVVVLPSKHAQTGRWVLPKGRLNLRESARRAAGRELGEEAGISPKALTAILKTLAPIGTYQDGSKRRAFFSAEMKGAPAELARRCKSVRPSREIRAVRLVTVDGAADLLKDPIDRRVLQTAIAGPAKHWADDATQWAKTQTKSLMKAGKKGPTSSGKEHRQGPTSRAPTTTSATVQ
jgi:8-oxo-dGTP pyrophosphatase MutT (NUDIX family)